MGWKLKDGDTVGDIMGDITVTSWQDQGSHLVCLQLSLVFLDLPYASLGISGMSGDHGGLGSGWWPMEEGEVGGRRECEGQRRRSEGLTLAFWLNMCSSWVAYRIVASASAASSSIFILSWCGAVRCGVVWCGVVWCSVVWVMAWSVVWCGAVWYGVCSVV